MATTGLPVYSQLPSGAKLTDPGGWTPIRIAEQGGGKVYNAFTAPKPTGGTNYRSPSGKTFNVDPSALPNATPVEWGGGTIGVMFDNAQTGGRNFAGFGDYTSGDEVLVPGGQYGRFATDPNWSGYSLRTISNLAQSGNAPAWTLPQGYQMGGYNVYETSPLENQATFTRGRIKNDTSLGQMAEDFVKLAPEYLPVLAWPALVAAGAGAFGTIGGAGGGAAAGGSGEAALVGGAGADTLAAGGGASAAGGAGAIGATGSGGAGGIAMTPAAAASFGGAGGGAAAAGGAGGGMAGLGALTWGDVASIAGTGLSAYTSLAAADKQADAASDAANASMAQYGQTRADLAPWMRGGQMALGDLLRMSGVGGDPMSSPLLAPFTQEKFKESPAYRFNLEQGLDAINKASAARHNYYAPQTLQDVGKFAQGMASNEWNNAYNMYNNDQSNIWQRLFALSGTGQNAAAQTGAFGANATNMAGQANMAGANAQAAGLVGASNAVTGGIGDVYNAWLTREILGQSQRSLYG